MVTIRLHFFSPFESCSQETVEILFRAVNVIRLLNILIALSQLFRIDKNISFML